MGAVSSFDTPAAQTPDVSMQEALLWEAGEYEHTFSIFGFKCPVIWAQCGAANTKTKLGNLTVNKIKKLAHKDVVDFKSELVDTLEYYLNEIARRSRRSAC